MKKSITLKVGDKNKVYKVYNYQNGTENEKTAFIVSARLNKIFKNNKDGFGTLTAISNGDSNYRTDVIVVNKKNDRKTSYTLDYKGPHFDKLVLSSGRLYTHVTGSTKINFE